MPSPAKMKLPFADLELPSAGHGRDQAKTKLVSRLEKPWRRWRSVRRGWGGFKAAEEGFVATEEGLDAL
jgi:hypothetical protein